MREERKGRKEEGWGRKDGHVPRLSAGGFLKNRTAAFPTSGRPKASGGAGPAAGVGLAAGGASGGAGLAAGQGQRRGVGPGWGGRGPGWGA